MKTLYIFLGLNLFTLLSLHAQQVDQVQRTLLSNKTATWCEYCGQWGLPLWDNMMLDNNNDKALPVALHQSSSSTLYSAVAKDIYNQFEVSSATPRFYTNKNMVPSGGVQAMRLYVKRLVDSLYLTAPIAGVGINFSIINNELTVNSKTKFFQADSGEFYVGTYLVFRNLQAMQDVHNVGDVQTTHHEILRYSATPGSSFGVSVASGSISAGGEYNKTFTYSMNAAWNLSDITIMTIIWRKNGSTYEFMNGTRKELQPTAIAQIEGNDAAINIYPKVSSNAVTLSVDKSANEDLSISIFDINGKLISSNTYPSGEWSSKTELSRDTHFAGQTGTFLIQVNLGTITKTLRVIML